MITTFRDIVVHDSICAHLRVDGLSSALARLPPSLVSTQQAPPPSPSRFASEEPWAIPCATCDRHSIFDIQHSIFDIEHSIFDIQHSIFDIQHSIFDLQHSIFDIEHSTCVIRYAIFAIPFSFDFRYSTFDVRVSICPLQAYRAKVSQVKLYLVFRIYTTYRSPLSGEP